MRCIIRVLLLLAISGSVVASPEAIAQPTPAPLAAAEKELVGRWFAEDYQATGEVINWLMVRRSDRTFTVWFQGRGSQHVSVETGRWTRHGSIYSTQTTAVDDKATDPDDPYFYDDYRLESVAKDRMIYYDRKRKARFHSRLVGGDFKFP